MKLEWLKKNMKDLKDKRIATYTLFISFKKKPGDIIQ